VPGPIVPIHRAVTGTAAGEPGRQVYRSGQLRRFLMCPPEHFDVTYAINAWMDPSIPVDRGLAMRQWLRLRQIYLDLGHEVVTVPAVPGLPDMVFAANGGLVVDGLAVGARFATRERAPEAALYRGHLRAAGLDVVHEPEFVNEGEGDLLVAGDVILAGTGFRTDPRAHAEIARLTGWEVVPLRLVDPRYYHLDTAACVIDATTIAYLPEAFDEAGQAELARRFPDAIRVGRADAEVLGLNAVSDGRHVVLTQEAEGIADQLRERGYVPVPVDLSELRKAGGGPKCCTMELRPEPHVTRLRPHRDADRDAPTTDDLEEMPA
jgi:N-dimethylarginine dimethylaminohydrolase